MFTLVGWQQSVTPTGVLIPVNAALDQHIAIGGRSVFIPSLNKLLAAYAAHPTASVHAQLQSPSLRRAALYDIIPIQQGIAPSAHEAFDPQFQSVIELDVNEGMEAWVAAPSGAAVVSTVLAWLGGGKLTPVVGEIFSVRVTASIATVVGSWGNGVLSFGQILPVGRYAIVGASMAEVGGDLIGFRFVVAGYGWRAGGLAVNSLAAKTVPEQRYGRMGVWCEFDSFTPPTLDILAGAAATHAIVGVLDLMKIA